MSYTHQYPLFYLKITCINIMLGKTSIETLYILLYLKIRHCIFFVHFSMIFFSFSFVYCICIVFLRILQMTIESKNIIIKKKYQHDLILWQCSSSLPLPHNIRKIIRNDLGLWFHIISDTWSASHAVNFRYLVKIYWLWVLCRFSAQLHWVVCDRGKILNWKKKRRPIS